MQHENDLTGRPRSPRPDAAAEVGKRALVVDDNAALLPILKRVLASAGYEVTTARDGAEAAQFVISRSFDVVLSDIQMPGMSGVELLQIVRSYDLDVPVILITANPTIETAIQALSLGAQNYLVKPVANDALLAAVEKASRLHRMARFKRAAIELVSGRVSEAGDIVGLAVGFERALASLWVAFQPIVRPGDRKVMGFEALMRAREPSLPDPGAILSAAERLHRLPELGRTMRDRTAAAFLDAPPNTRLFVNLHTQDLLDPSLYAEGSSLMQFASRVVLEVTERSTIEAIGDVNQRVAVLRFHQFQIAIDDLGAGYAGLSSFVALEPDIVKLDMSLIRDIDRSTVKQRLVGSMVSLSNEMGIEVVAEGIETEAEAAVVEGLGCDLMQGYLFGRPGAGFGELAVA